MKIHSIFLVLALVLGIGIGWLIKPGREAAATVGVTEDNIPSRPEAEPRGRADREGDEEVDSPRRKTKTRTLVIGDGEELTPEEQAMQDQIKKAMSDRQLKADERKIAALVEKLGLDAAQEASLREYFESRRDKIVGIFSGDGSDASDMSNVSEKKLDELMVDILTDDQQEVYEEVKTADREKKVESRALKDLAKINGIIDLRPEQKDSVYQVLYDDAGVKVDKAAESGMSVFGAMVGDSFGVSMDLDAAEMHDTAYLIDDETGDLDRDGQIQAFRDARQKRVDEQVERLEPVLDEDQLSAYREHLESQGSVFESFMSPAAGE
ncbi:hypothetical protein [Haloferula sp.]|uniref:hypothetical protein n=1 Tax=Haloferula sp. TaxID=2497595 RepID=UPI00329C7569